MKIREFINLTKGYEDFEIELAILFKDKTKWGLSLDKHPITIADIGHSEKVIQIAIYRG